MPHEMNKTFESINNNKNSTKICSYSVQSSSNSQFILPPEKIVNFSRSKKKNLNRRIFLEIITKFCSDRNAPGILDST